MPSPSSISYLIAPDQHRITLRTWRPAGPAPRGLVHVCHGMAEHGGRYAELADHLNAAGWILVAHDHRGHGRDGGDGSNGGDGDACHYADHHGWELVTADVAQVQQTLKAAHPGLPLVLMGHSMGAMIVQGYLVGGPSFWPDAVVLSGPSRDPRGKIRVLRQIVRFEVWRRGQRQPSALLNRLTFGAFSRSVKRPTTPFDWLSQDATQVRAYIDDPLCGAPCSTGLWRDLSDGLMQITAKSSFSRWPAALPVYIFAGSRDPVGAFGQGPRALAGALQAAGLGNVETRLYPAMRHETLHETDRQQVMADLSQWLARQIAVRDPACAFARGG